LPHAPEANVSGAGAPAKPQKSREFFEIRGFFFGRAGFLAAEPLFFCRRSPQTLAFRGRNGELWVELCCRFAWGGDGRLHGEGRVSAWRREAPRHSGA